MQSKYVKCYLPLWTGEGTCNYACIISTTSFCLSLSLSSKFPLDLYTTNYQICLQDVIALKFDLNWFVFIIYNLFYCITYGTSNSDWIRVLKQNFTYSFRSLYFIFIFKLSNFSVILITIHVGSIRGQISKHKVML